MCALRILRIHDVGQSVSSQSKNMTVLFIGKAAGKCRWMRGIVTSRWGFSESPTAGFCAMTLVRDISCTAGCLFSGEEQEAPPDINLDLSFMPFFRTGLWLELFDPSVSSALFDPLRLAWPSCTGDMATTFLSSAVSSVSMVELHGKLRLSPRRSLRHWVAAFLGEPAMLVVELSTLEVPVVIVSGPVLLLVSIAFGSLTTGLSSTPRLVNTLPVLLLLPSSLIASLLRWRQRSESSEIPMSSESSA
mmetsp:Transcript_43065/g.91801  ORF Transcript_43065/g.91801 Transcript_43065/m.91801 type:complete len:247 (-) Transcript_43065:494-1234(-)